MTSRGSISTSDDESIRDARAGAFETPDEGSDEAPTSDSIATREPFKAADLVGTFGLVVATVASLLLAGWSYASMQDLRGQLASASGEKALAIQALADSQSHLAATEKALGESESRLSMAEKAVAGVKAALTASASTKGTPAATVK